MQIIELPMFFKGSTQAENFKIIKFINLNKNIVASTEHHYFRFGSETNLPFSECTLSKAGFPSQECNVDLSRTENKCERKSYIGSDQICHFDLLYLNESGNLIFKCNKLLQLLFSK
jgi:hypothetical protein